MYRTLYFIDSRGITWLICYYDYALRHAIHAILYRPQLILFMSSCLWCFVILDAIHLASQLHWGGGYEYPMSPTLLLSYVLLYAGRDAFIPSTCYIASTHWLLRTLSDLTLFCHHLWNHGVLSYWLLPWYARWPTSAYMFFFLSAICAARYCLFILSAFSAVTLLLPSCSNNFLLVRLLLLWHLHGVDFLACYYLVYGQTTIIWLCH